MGELIIVTGPPGAGKSTVAPLVADGSGSSVLIPADWFFSLWHRGAIDPWLPEAQPQTSVAFEAATATAGTFARANCHVVFDGFVPPHALGGFAAVAGTLHYVVLLPPEKTCVARVAARSSHGFTSEEATRAMYHDFTKAAVPGRHLITDTDKTPEQLAKRIVADVTAGSLLWPANGGRLSVPGTPRP